MIDFERKTGQNEMRLNWYVIPVPIRVGSSPTQTGNKKKKNRPKVRMSLDIRQIQKLRNAELKRDLHNPRLSCLLYMNQSYENQKM